ncbi:hypothetical protein GGR56DRAFT_347920 [Xylariaceae sp. FL0804]|nr:hypothetical protein GGR56DRAFT_347920 [Xylariaceae sp. FL0804]
MPPWDKNRNYYADLGVSPNASAEEVKKQYRKLALQWHPDRNPGREADVNSTFLKIQSAHEILTDATLKREYDEARRSSRHPMASGVRGNPWANVAKEFPKPPTRSRPTSRPTAGAQRYETFTSSMPRASNTAPKEDPQTRRSNAEAWESMRGQHSTRSRAQAPPPTPGRAPTSAARNAKPSGPPPNLPPRTAYQRQKAEASFGNSTRRPGFTPHSPVAADEPPVTNKNYHTNRTHSFLFTTRDTGNASASTAGASPIPDPLAQFRDKFMDGRQSTPYATPGGEKTSLFDDEPVLGRTSSTRTPPRKAEMPGAFPGGSRPRSSSTPKSSNNDGGSDESARVNTGTGARTSAYNTNTFQSRTGDRYKPSDGIYTSSPPLSPTTAKAGQPEPAHAAHASVPSSDSAQTDGSGPSTYGPYTFYLSQGKARPSHTSSEAAKGSSASLFPLEAKQRNTLANLVFKNSPSSSGKVVEGAKYDPGAPWVSASKPSRFDANSTCTSSFAFGEQRENGAMPFPSNGADNINTTFAYDDNFDGLEFKAGSAPAGEPFTPSRSRAQSRSRLSRRPTPKARPSPMGSSPPKRSAPDDAYKQGFSAGEWNEQIGSQHFAPQTSHSASVSPTRRPISKKPSKPVKMTAGTAGMVDPEAGEGWQEVPSPALGTPRRSTDAMDIDTPPADGAEETPKAARTNGARNIPVEPHRADWRAGDVNSAHANAENWASGVGPTETTASGATSAPTAAAHDFAAHLPHGGSEDTDEIRNTFSTFSDFKNVEPFADPVPTGLKSFADLKSTLPFQSRPSEQIPLEKDQAPAPAPLTFPPVPVAPRIPQDVVGVRPNVASFRKYAGNFHLYMDKWATFNKRVVDHFTSRQNNFETRRSLHDVRWLDSKRLDSKPDGSNSRDYLVELEQDQAVRSQWMEACIEHRKRVAEYVEVRDRIP